LIDVIERTRIDGTIHARINERAKLPARKAATADNVYYVKSRVMSAQVEAAEVPRIGTGAGIEECLKVSSDYQHSGGMEEIAGPGELLERFYADVLHELDEFGRRPSATALGAAVVVKRVAQAYGVAIADRLPLPRLNRAELQDRAESEWRAEH
jgi:hypothetical protein